MKIYCTGKIGDSGHMNRKLEGSMKISRCEVLWHGSKEDWD